MSGRVSGSVRGKLTAMSVGTGVIALLVACTTFLTYELVSYRERMVADLLSNGQVLASNSVAALVFDDPRSATDTLSAVSAIGNVRSAVLKDKTGQPFVTYQRPPGATPAALEGTQYRFEGGLLFLDVPVTLDGNRAGTLSLEADLGPLRQRIRRYLALTLLVLIGSLLFAVATSTRMHRHILAPVMDLTLVAQSVSRHRDYSARVPVSGSDELAMLGRTVNEMLGQIQRQNQELERAVKMRDEFLSVASHELKTPLTSLRLQLYSLGREVTAAGQPRLLGMDRQVRRLAKLVDDMLDLSRITAGRLELQLEELDLVALTRESIQRLQSQSAQAGCRVELHAEEKVKGWWDAAKLEQIVINLLSNAIKYGAGKPVEVHVWVSGGQAHLAVRDHGIGIAEPDIKRIFERFERAVSVRHFGGFGLGLWIVRQLLEAHGGTIRVTSEPGEGALFDVALPIQPALGRGERSPPSPAEASEQPSAP